MSTPANNFGISCKREEHFSTHWPQFNTSGQKCGFSSNAECQSFKRPRMMNSKMGPEDNRSMNLGPQPPCLQFKRWGSCSYGNECRYAHITGRLNGIRVEDQRNLSKPKSCHYFDSGKECPYGNKCHFLHERNQKLEGGVGFCRVSSAISIATSGREHKRTVELRKELLKTKFCVNWERTGSCAYGSKCQFAHGKAELQTLGSSNTLEPLGTSGISAPAKTAASECRFLFKWTNVQKISQIYADWIERVQLVPLSSHTMEN
ncbi:PREDICTED: zinc finger CCCH domain-containing protein 37-like [Nicotiana attenuata]|uniref:Zinc finger ccch domain-containing protein 39 n=1 Tax=Nicotiana attenuata TaxID=49451 RepID=A0A1J6IK27_NICAT|nr:PREDICTED: zinc finger CCCH domain-containing protein 37-like [Nicotiana attenuata]OIT05074.1 zinc finger ccch domain-containing protein 39 [Nicotiana attenuata]